MIPLVDASWQGQPWQWQLAHSVSTARELSALLKIQLEDVPADFPLRVPHAFVSRMEAGDPQDPLLRQVLPVSAELDQVDGYTTDPVGDNQAIRQAGLLQKYSGRVLAVVTGACAINCRYCFRRHFPYGDFQPGTAAWDRIIDTVGNDTTISEVILSGGDPLALSDRRLTELTSRFRDMAHVDTIRLHTRLPVVIPDRVTDEMLRWMSEAKQQVVIVLHVNHPNEIDSAVERAASRLRSSGACLLNQSVLLAGVNDSATTLTALSRRLFSIGVLPYYLHQLDPVAGASHFEVADDVALSLVSEIRTALPGYLVPRLVREEEGAPSKVPLT